MRKQVRLLSAVFDDCVELNKNTNCFFLPPLWHEGNTTKFAALQQHYLRKSDLHVVAEMFQDAGRFPYLRIPRTICPLGLKPVKRQMVWMKKGAGGEGTVRDWVGKARERIGMAVGRVPNAHSEDQSLEPLCAGNTKRLALRLVDNGPMGVQRQLNFQRARGKRCPSLSVLSNGPKRHKDTLWTWQRRSHPRFHIILLQI